MTKGRKIDFMGNFIAESTAYFSLIFSLLFLNFSLKPKFFKNNFLKKNFVFEGHFSIFHTLLIRI